MWQDKLKQRPVQIAIAILFILSIIACLTYFSQNKTPEIKQQTKKQEEPPNKVKENNEVEATTTVTIDIKGAVKSPGVYTLKKDARVKDAVAKAGGLLNDADPKSINLAAKLKDEMVVTVYSKGEKDSIQTSEESNDKQKINLNEAKEAELTTVPGIGPAKARAIIDYREKEGLFKEVADLKNISGIGAKTIDKLAEYLTVE
ncbi:helix-hairpin-helix domain-containing protein [Listeria sp. PSOL-1]|uniref:helix-hairpin-helix domain-containing protein n=1 Tax=Listeria sp. PSOL-1 TaxID=1844999 RepID=UPI0013D2FA0C|nr:helix-hairpin-helix domain-containing protein [Listeria sp. PSOL-1]